MSISSTGLYGSATIVNTDIFDDVQALKEQVTTLSTSFWTTTNEHRIDISQNRLSISSNLSKINDLSDNRIVAIEQDITDISNNTYVCLYVHTSVYTDVYIFSASRGPVSPARKNINILNIDLPPSLSLFLSPPLSLSLSQNLYHVKRSARLSQGGGVEREKASAW